MTTSYPFCLRNLIWCRCVDHHHYVPPSPYDHQNHRTSIRPASALLYSKKQSQTQGYLPHETRYHAQLLQFQPLVTHHLSVQLVYAEATETGQWSSLWTIYSSASLGGSFTSSSWKMFYRYSDVKKTIENEWTSDCSQQDFSGITLSKMNIFPLSSLPILNESSTYLSWQNKEWSIKNVLHLLTIKNVRLNYKMSIRDLKPAVWIEDL